MAILALAPRVALARSTGRASTSSRKQLQSLGARLFLGMKPAGPKSPAFWRGIAPFTTERRRAAVALI
jgi:hypothetical protein